MLNQLTTERSSITRPGRATFALVGLLLGAGAIGADDPKVPAKAQPKVAKLDIAKEVVLDNEIGARGFQLPAQPVPQTLTVKFSSSKGEVSVYVFREADVRDADAMLTADPKKALAGKTGKTGDFSADLSAKSEVVVVIRGATEKTTVDVKITNETLDPKDAQIKKLEEENAALKKELAELKKQLADLKKQLEKK